MNNNIDTFITQFGKDYHKFRKQFKGPACLTEYYIIGYLFDTLSEEENLIVNDHLHSCFYCVNELINITLELKQETFCLEELEDLRRKLDFERIQALTGGVAKSILNKIKSSFRKGDFETARELLEVLKCHSILSGLSYGVAFYLDCFYKKPVLEGIFLRIGIRNIIESDIEAIRDKLRGHVICKYVDEFKRSRTLKLLEMGCEEGNQEIGKAFQEDSIDTETAFELADSEPACERNLLFLKLIRPLSLGKRDFIKANKLLESIRDGGHCGNSKSAILENKELKDTLEKPVGENYSLKKKTDDVLRILNKLKRVVPKPICHDNSESEDLTA